MDEVWCCKCEEYGGGTRKDDLLPVVYIDPFSQNGYCALHAPVGQKRKMIGGELYTPQGFNEIVFERIKIAKRDKVKCELQSTVFEWDIDFEKCDYTLPAISFFRAEFYGVVNFSEVHFTGEANFGEATFKSQAHFFITEFFDGALFDSATFCQPVSLFGISSSALFSFCDVTIESGTPVRINSITCETMRRLMFGAGDVESIKFIDCDWPEKLALEQYGFYSAPNVLVCTELYRAMKQRAALDQDQKLVSQWHYREKLMMLKLMVVDHGLVPLMTAVEDDYLCWRGRIAAWIEFTKCASNDVKLSLLFLYWTTSGFGERYKRAILILSILVLFPLFLFAFAMLCTTGLSWQIDAAAVAEVFTDWQRALPLSKVPSDPPPAAWKLWVCYLSQLVITVQAALFGFAVRNRFRR